MNKLFFLSLLELSAAHAKKSREIFTTLGISDAQPKILYILLAEDGWLQKDLAEFCKISPASMTILLNNMEKKNLVKRKKTQLSNGKRAFQICLTSTGRNIAEKVHDEMDKLETLTLSNFSQEEKDQFFSLMDKACHNLNDH
ncbi:MAG: MarR family transcriptional regulator [Eubacterium sp.]|nr:MarR family transcriptional regulator [Eubacterium sp.]